jgi:MFS family permease
LASCNTILQTIVDERQRGRVMSLYTTAFLGMSPLGSLFAGSIASAIGAPRTLQIGGIIVLFGGIGFAIQLRSLRKHIRPIYTRMGILPAVASGLQQATEQTVPPEET